VGHRRMSALPALEPQPTPPVSATAAALKVEDLNLAYMVRGIPRPVLRGVSFEVKPGESYGLVGESGCGKSTTAYAAVRYLPRNARITGGRILVAGEDITKKSGDDLRTFRTHHASMVYQDPGAALNPSTKIGPQVVEAFTVLGQRGDEAMESALAALKRVQIADPERVMGRYPHQLSGGMQQRVVIAMALASDPQLLVLDEPTTGLDATVEASVLDLVRALIAETSSAVLLIAHNLGVIRTMCDRVGVMYAGKIVEEGRASRVFERPQHPYTVGLLRALPRHGVRKSERPLATIPGTLPQIGTPLPTCVFVDRCPLATDLCRETEPPVVDVGDGQWTRCHHWERIGEIKEPAPGIAQEALPQGDLALRLEGVSKTFRAGGHDVPALVGVDLQLFDGETLGLVGESGSGKSTLAKTILGIEGPDPGGHIRLSDHDLGAKATQRPSGDKRQIQMVFQNPDSALNRGKSVRSILGRSVSKLTGLSGKAVDQRVDKLAENLRLTQRHLDLKPRQLSGGLKQRVAIARAFAGDPRIVVADEPTSALDVSVQAAILNVLSELQAENKTSYLLISHDLGVVRYLADRIAVMYLGRVQEVGDSETIFRGPNHPYTEALLSAVPNIDGEERTRIRLDGEVPSPANPPSGCVFHTRCPRVIQGLCEVTEPPLAEVEPGHLMKCHIPLEELRRLQSQRKELVVEEQSVGPVEAV
ncbi:MAG TPA: ABC transporter ATP-binding protein, partial [Candidatus Limnocylindrales bacterium]|nr:ABC transporter ATP-binding protein [Candidatus Limnocylindrales bacterium]